MSVAANENVPFRTDYRDYLRSEFELRQARRPYYSLRAFARDLQISPASLSEIMNGRYGLSRARALSVGKKIQLSAEQLDHFADLMLLKREKKSEERRLAEMRVGHRLNSTQNSLALETFRIIADWYHLAILELFYLKGFRPEPKWIAKALKIKVSAARDALDRLLKVGMIEKTTDGYRVKEDFTFVGNSVPSDAVRLFHKQLLEKARQAIFTQAIDERDLNSTILSMRKHDLPELKKMIREFAAQASSKVSGKADRDSVYCLAIQCFALAQSQGDQNETVDATL